MDDVSGRLAAALLGGPLAYLAPARLSPWDAVVSASAPSLAGDELQFVVTGDRQTIAQDGSAPALDPLVDALCHELDPPFCAVAVRDEGDVWAAAASRAQIVDVPGAAGSEITISRVDGAVTTQVDGGDSEFRHIELEKLLDREKGDVDLIAHRFTGSRWIVETFPL
jgi:hypothetical protein